MKVLIAFILILETFNCLGQKPIISFGSLKDSIVEKDELLLNEGIIFSNDTSSNIKCLQAVDFSFSIVKLNGDTVDIKTNYCTKQINNQRYEKAIIRFDKGKNSRYLNKISKCNGNNRFNSKQLKAIKKMKSGETILINLVKTRPSNCSCLGRLWAAGLKYKIK